MKITFSNETTVVNKSAKSIVAIFVTKEQAVKAQSDLINYAKQNFNFKGRVNQSHVVPSNDKLSIVIGLGSEKKLNDLTLQKAGATALAYANNSKAEVLTIFFGYDVDKNGKVKANKVVAKHHANIAFGAMLQSYRFNKYFNNKLKGKEIAVKNVNVATTDNAAVKKEFHNLEILANNIFFTRNLVSEPSNVLNPESYAKICEGLKKDGLQVEILGEKEMQKLGMNSLLGVGQGSVKESKLVVMKWNGGKAKDQPLAFVGKGVTFDTGGISIKPANNMEDMKTDMSGSAVVVGLMRNLAQRKAKVNVVGVIGLVENMPDGNAQRPGDVVKSMSGQTIEVINTDAEGRLVLADALHYTNTKFKPKLIVDLATLTGAIIVALADAHAGLFSNSNELSKQLKKAGKAVNETLWRLPMGKEYDDMINSDIADMKNVGSGRGAGSITAAQFLKRFVGKTKWAHLDIAGVAWKGKGNAFAVKGATGFGVRLLNQFVADNYE